MALSLALIVAGPAIRPARADANGTWVRTPPARNVVAAGWDSTAGMLRLVGTDEARRAVVWSYQPGSPGAWSAGELLSGLPGLSTNREGEITLDLAGRRAFLHSASLVYYPDSARFVSVFFQMPLDGSPTWQEIVASGDSLDGYSDSALAFDPQGQRLFLFGGVLQLYVRPDVWTNDVRVLELAGDRQWRTIDPVGPRPEPQTGAHMVFDPVGNQLLVMGGVDNNGSGWRPQLWALRLDDPPTWQRLAAQDSLSYALYRPNLAIDATGRRLYAAGSRGHVEDPAVDTTRFWEINLSTGHAQPFFTAPCPAADRNNAVLAWDATDRRLWLAGGFGLGTLGRTVWHDDLWQSPVDGPRQWSRVLGGEAPPTGSSIAHTFDSQAGRETVLHDVYAASVVQFDDIPRRTSVEFASTSIGLPPRRELASLVADTERHRILMYGGAASGGGELSDLWEGHLDTGLTWTRLLPQGIPPLPRYGASLTYDPLRHRAILFGGYAGQPMNDTWELALDTDPPTWREIPTRGTPPPGRVSHAAVYDPLRDGLLVFGGRSSLNEYAINDPNAWFLSFADCNAWTSLPASGTPPSPRYDLAMTYDSGRDRALLFYGRNGSATRVDVFALSLAGTPAWSQLQWTGTVPGPVAGHFAVYDVLRDRVVLGGGYGFGADGDDWMLEFGEPGRTPPPPPPGPPTRVLTVGPNPSRGPVNLTFDLTARAAVRARIYDARGRLVRDLGEHTYAPGRHVLCWDPREQGLARLARGLYFARVTMGDQVFSGKIVLYE